MIIVSLEFKTNIGILRKFISYGDVCHLSTKLREGNVFSGVCLLTWGKCVCLVPCSFQGGWICLVPHAFQQGDKYAWSRVLSGGVGIVGPRSLLGTSEGTPWKVHLPGKVHPLEGTPPGTDI